MCLAVPSRVVELHEDGTATVDTMGVKRKVSLELLEDVKVGDYVLIHVGFAIQVLDEETALESLRLFEEILSAEERFHEGGE